MNDLIKKPILITGSSGFVGSNLARHLVKLGARQVNVILRKSSDTERLKDILPDLKIHYADLGDFRSLLKAAEKIVPYHIFHAATYGSYPYQSDDELLISTNVTGTLNLLKAVSGIKYRSFINIGSSSEYGIMNRSMRESDALCPVNTYGVSKAAASMLAQSFAAKFNKNITTVRIFSAYGPYEEKGRLIPSVINAFLFKNEFSVSSPDAVRDFIYIEDIADLILKIALSDKYAPVVNLGTGRQYRVNDVISIVSELTGRHIRVKQVKPHYQRSEPEVWRADMTLARTIFGWKAGIPLKEGLSRTIEWIRDHRDFYKDNIQSTHLK